MLMSKCKYIKASWTVNRRYVMFCGGIETRVVRARILLNRAAQYNSEFNSITVCKFYFNLSNFILFLNYFIG